MKAQSGIKKQKGFSTLEMMIAFALMLIALSGAISAAFSAQYWSITSQTSNEALYKAKTNLEILRANAKGDFYTATSTHFHPDNCVAGQLCYYSETKVSDLSNCSKYATTQISWKVTGYPTTTTSLATNLTNVDEAVRLGGDCLLNQPAGSWDTHVPVSSGELNFNPGKKFSGLDILHKKIYVIATSTPYFMVYDIPNTNISNPTPIGSINGDGKQLNAIDTYEDLSTGRKYAFVAENSTSLQLGVIDITDSNNPEMVKEISLSGITSPGTLSEGWRIFAYGGRLYITCRDTAGHEFHIFNINIPTQPSEIGDGYELTRTITDMVIREQTINGAVHRFAFLASSADTKELSVLDITNDIVSEIISVDLPGSADAKSIFILGNTLYLGRENNTSGPELYAFDATNPLLGLPQLGSAEFGADVDRIKVSGNYLFAVVYKLFNESSNEVQVWSSDYTLWNTGRLQSYGFSNLAPLGLDIDEDNVYVASYLTSNDSIKVLKAP